MYSDTVEACLQSDEPRTIGVFDESFAVVEVMTPFLSLEFAVQRILLPVSCSHLSLLVSVVLSACNREFLHETTERIVDAELEVVFINVDQAFGSIWVVSLYDCIESVFADRPKPIIKRKQSTEIYGPYTNLI